MQMRIKERVDEFRRLKARHKQIKMFFLSVTVDKKSQPYLIQIDFFISSKILRPIHINGKTRTGWWLVMRKESLSFLHLNDNVLLFKFKHHCCEDFFFFVARWSTFTLA